MVGGVGNVATMADLGGLESELRRIPGVDGARVVFDNVGKPSEIHVLASLAKHPKQIVRDVQSVAKAAFDADIDRRIVSVVQLDGHLSSDGDDPEDDDEIGGDGGSDPTRVVVDGVSIIRSGPRANAEVRLGRHGAQAIGRGEGAATATLLPSLVARATLDALGYLEPNAGRLEIEAATLQQVGARSVALVSLVLLGPSHEESLFGAAMVRQAGSEDAVVRAVLNAVNRRLAFTS